MSLETKELFETKFLNIDLEQFVDVLKRHLEEETKTFIVTANPITILQTKDDEHFKNAVQTANYVTPDGVGILLAAKFMKKPLKERVTGYDLMMKLLNVANEHRYKIYLYGAHPDIIKLAVNNIETDYPNIDVCGYSDGYRQGDDLQKVTEEIKAKRPDLVFVALGVPKQELWIKDNIGQFEKGVFIGVGGSFDVLSGKSERAPVVYQKLGIEWVYRMVKEPFRLKRAGFLPRFFFELAKEKYKK